jgi:hypothetical protein
LADGDVGLRMLERSFVNTLVQTDPPTITPGDLAMLDVLKDERPSQQPRRGKRRPEYAIWAMLKYRCLNPQSPEYRNYGGRGVRFSERWCGPDGFKTFLADVGPQPFPGAGLRRLDPQGHFEPCNVTWEDRRRRLLTYKGRSMSVAEWARDLNLRVGTLRARLRKGWPLARALTRTYRPSDWGWRLVERGTGEAAGGAAGHDGDGCRGG